MVVINACRIDGSDGGQWRGWEGWEACWKAAGDLEGGEN